MKLKNIALTIGLAVIGATAYTINYLAQNDEFSNDTKEDLDLLVSNAKNVGKDVKRTYTSLINKENIDKPAKSLQKNLSNLFDNSVSLTKNASEDVYNYIKDNINKEENKKNIKSKNIKNKTSKSKKTVLKKTSKKK